MSESLSMLAKLVEGQLVLPDALDFQDHIVSASTLETATTDAITLVDSAERLSSLAKSQAAAAIVPVGTGTQDRPTIEVSDVHKAFAIIIQHFRPPRTRHRQGVSPQAVIDPSARLAGDVEVLPLAHIGPDVELAEGVVIHAGAQIGAGCRIGAGTTVFANAVLYDDTLVGRNCVIHSNAVWEPLGLGTSLMQMVWSFLHNLAGLNWVIMLKLVLEQLLIVEHTVQQ